MTVFVLLVCSQNTCSEASGIKQGLEDTSVVPLVKTSVMGGSDVKETVNRVFVFYRKRSCVKPRCNAEKLKRQL